MKKQGTSRIKRRGLSLYPGSAGRAVASFEYVGSGLSSKSDTPTFGSLI